MTALGTSEKNTHLVEYFFHSLQSEYIALQVHECSHLLRHSFAIREIVTEIVRFDLFVVIPGTAYTDENVRGVRRKSACFWRPLLGCKSIIVVVSNFCAKENNITLQGVEVIERAKPIIALLSGCIAEKNVAGPATGSIGYGLDTDPRVSQIPVDDLQD